MTYPFSAIVGHDQLRLALVLCAVRPEIGGVLIRGEKGTAKSTAVRGLAHVLAAVDGGHLVELPIGATEDRVVGSLDLQKVLRDGEHAFSPGLLARAHGGVLYVDEVNLLHDHLVDVLLDAAAMGRVHVERDGVSHSHEARFVLIGTMNPEEGELRPQLLDRFGLTVDVHASRDVEVRAEVIRARLAFEADPDAFARPTPKPTPSWPAASPRPGRRSPMWCCRTTSYAASRRCVRRSTSTGCAPTWWSRGPRWRTRPGAGRRAVAEEDIRVAAELALPHRRRRDPFDDPGLDPDRLDDALAQAGEAADDPDPDPPGGGEAAPGEPSEYPDRNGIRDRQPGPTPRRRRCSGPGRWWYRVSGRARPAGARAPATAPAPWSRPPPNPMPATACTCSPHCWPPPADSSGRAVRAPTPTTCDARYGKAARAIW